MKFVIVVVIVSVLAACLYAGHTAVRSWRAGVAVRAARVRTVE